MCGAHVHPQAAVAVSWYTHSWEEQNYRCGQCHRTKVHHLAEVERAFRTAHEALGFPAMVAAASFLRLPCV
jgi:hypothetical protein